MGQFSSSASRTSKATKEDEEGGSGRNAANIANGPIAMGNNNIESRMAGSSFDTTIRAPCGGRMRGNYVAEKNIGLGGFGIVDLARHRKTGQLVALKTFRADTLAKMTSGYSGNGRDGVQKALLIEVALQSMCRHQNVLPILEWFSNGNRLEGIALEYCSGGSLQEYLDGREKIRKKLGEEVVARWMTHILSALKHIHAVSIAHLDVKPANFLLDNLETSVLKLSDFGVSAYIPHGTTCRARGVGTPLYMAPEVASGVGFAHKADCWSAGVVFLCLLQASFGLNNGMGVMRQESAPAISDIRWRQRPPVEALRLLEGLLSQSDASRYSARRGLTAVWVERHAKFSAGNVGGIGRSNNGAADSSPERGKSTASARRRSSSAAARMTREQSPLPSRRKSVEGKAPLQDIVDGEPSPREALRGRKTSPVPQAPPESQEEVKARKKELAKINYIISIFDTTGTGRLDLPSLQDLFAAANPAYYNKDSKFPSAKMFSKSAKSSKDGMSAEEIRELVSGNPGYCSRLAKKIEKWNSLSEIEREERKLLKLNEKPKNLGVLPWGPIPEKCN